MNTENFDLPEGVNIRHGDPSDHPRIIKVMKDWWDGRDLTSMLPRLFLEHFFNTSMVMEDRENELIAFLIGFLSQSQANECYIHFVGVHPEYRGLGFGTYLYRQFFQTCKENHRTIVRACTSPVNKGSIEFHKKMGFQIEPGNGQLLNVSVTLDYNCPGDPKVLFVKKLYP
ncbi:MAG: GNAT family N-acetyltransferase [Desulfobacteraceae bacterium]|nr:GNAT family N-acetyltransferase [Desulfobacteraceae bacterium]